jgi:hypothetical protein
MSIRVGLYDFFAYTIPGSLYLFTIIYLGVVLGWVYIDFQMLNNLSLVQIGGFIAFAYITGLTLDTIARYWHRFFKPKWLSKKVFDDFKAKYAHLEIRFRYGDWAVLLAHLRSENIDVAAEIERLNVTSIMLRNISLNLAFLAALQIFEFIKTNFVWHPVLFAAFIFLSIMAGRESTKFQAWFFSAIFEAITARSLEISDLVVRKQDNNISIEAPEAVKPVVKHRPTTSAETGEKLSVK